MSCVNSVYLRWWLTVLTLMQACSSSDSRSSAGTTTTNNSNTNVGTKVTTATSSAAQPNTTSATISGNNVMSVTVNGSLCGDAKYQYPNEPCTSVTICEHGTSHCQTIDNILLDTGSSGLRLFKSLVTVATTPVTVGGNNLGECISFTGNASEWGPVVNVDVKLGGEPAVQVPIQLIDPTWAAAPAICAAPQTTPDSSPEEAGFNGILGVGTWNNDCGSTCSTSSNNGMYYSCAVSGSGCVGVATSVQVQNPVALLPTDNNGVILGFPSVGIGGVASQTGSLILGIGTQTNNTPGSVTMLTTDSNGLISTVFAASSTKVWTSFIDSGTPTMFVPSAPSLTECTASSKLDSFFCPSTEQTATAVNYNKNFTVSSTVTFQVGDAEAMNASKNVVFSDLAQVLSTSSNGGTDGNFCWGMPFFFGRNVITGIEDKTSTLGVGPYYAY